MILITSFCHHSVEQGKKYRHLSIRGSFNLKDEELLSRVYPQYNSNTHV